MLENNYYLSSKEQSVFRKALRKSVKILGDNMTETENKNYQALEELYPELERRHKGWKLIGFDPKAKPKLTLQNPYGMVPIYRYYGWNLKSKYTGEILRQLRAERGVGNVKKIKTVV